MLVKNLNKRSGSVVTSMGIIQFNEEGIAGVEDNLAQSLSCMKGYEIVVEKPHDSNFDKELNEDEKTDESESDIIKSIALMTIEQLKQYSKENNIDLKGATRKPEILDIIKGCTQL